MFDDYIVDPLFRGELQRIALRARRLNPDPLLGFSPHICLEALTRIELGQKGQLRIESNTIFTKEPFAYVEYKPSLVLHVDREMWSEIRQGYPYARHLAAHELLHILCHDHHAMGFHGNPAAFAKAYGEERSAEWQANTFALFFLIPDGAFDSFFSANGIAQACNVEIEHAQQRIELFEKMNKARFNEWRDAQAHIRF